MNQFMNQVVIEFNLNYVFVIFFNEQVFEFKSFFN